MVAKGGFMKNEFDSPVKRAVSKRIQEVVNDNRIGSNKALADLIGVKPQSVTNWIQRGQIKSENARKIQEVLGYDMGWILANDVATTDIGANQTINSSTVNITTANNIYNNNQAELLSHEQGLTHRHKIDYYDVRLAAGLTGFENSDYPEIISSLYLTDEGMAQLVGKKSADGICLVNVPTDSMEPTIRKGDIVFLDTKVNAYSGDGIYAFSIDGALFIKRIQKLVGGGYRLHSDNKDNYDPQDISEDICQNAKFIGRFIRTIHIETINL